MSRTEPRTGYEIIQKGNERNRRLMIVEGDRGDASSYADPENKRVVGDKVQIVGPRPAH